MNRASSQVRPRRYPALAAGKVYSVVWLDFSLLLLHLLSFRIAGTCNRHRSVSGYVWILLGSSRGDILSSPQEGYEEVRSCDSTLASVASVSSSRSCIQQASLCVMGCVNTSRAQPIRYPALAAAEVYQPV